LGEVTAPDESAARWVVHGTAGGKTIRPAPVETKRLPLISARERPPRERRAEAVHLLTGTRSTVATSAHPPIDQKEHHSRTDRVTANIPCQILRPRLERLLAGGQGRRKGPEALH
jgi:hypothetical protein